MKKPTKDPWPMENYESAWKTFRDKSDENKATAKCLLGRSTWPRKAGLTICDLGCGDGRLLGTILKSDLLKGKVQGITLLDPHKKWLDDANRRIKEKYPRLPIKIQLGGVAKRWPGCASGADVALAVHVVYFMSAAEVKSLIAKRPNGTSLFIVLDAPDSVFTQLWKLTAKRFHQRSLRAHAILKDFLGRRIDGAKSIIKSTVALDLLHDNPYAIELRSILCYRDMRKRSSPALNVEVEKILKAHVPRGRNYVECTSICYEISDES